MESTYKTFKKIYKKSAAEKLQELLGALICVAVLVVIVAGVLGIDLV